ncbi:hypothetical protein [Caudoviricetes sp.]|nr:hypothetical protein [Caudoviricetes sp.]UOF78377.1 hypothetical protein [Bacteriophage sp.]
MLKLRPVFYSHKLPKKRATPGVSPFGVGGLAQYQQTPCVTLLRNAAKRLFCSLHQKQFVWQLFPKQQVVQVTMRPPETTV